MKVKLLEDAFDEILDSIVKTLEDKIHVGEYLDTALAVYRGDRTIKAPKAPCLWVFPDVGTCSHPPATFMESWTLPIRIVSVVHSNDAEEGFKQANKLAAKARYCVLQDRSLGLRDFVQDTRSDRFEYSNPGYVMGNLYSAVAVIVVTFNILEKGE